MADKTDDQRLSDVKELLRKTRKGQTLTLTECANIWGVAKPRFVVKRAEMDFPDHLRVEKNAQVYDRRAALNAMKAFLERREKDAKARSDKLAKLTGAKKTPDSGASEFSISDLAKANQVRRDLQNEAVEQGELVKASEVSYLLSWIFSAISEAFADLSNTIDPHGRLPGWASKLIDEAGEKLLMELYNKIKGRLLEDVDSSTNRKPARKPRARKASGKRK